MAKYLLVVADDFSACPEIDEGILKAVKAGNIDCIDCFVTFPRSEEAIHNFKHFRAEEEIASGRLKMGLHLTLTAGFPVSKNISSNFKKLVTKASTNEFWQITRQQLDYLWKKYPEDLMHEMVGQYDRFVEVYGAPPVHVSCHEGFFHLSKELTELYLTFAKERNLLIRNPKLASTIGKDAIEWREETPMVKRAKKNVDNIAANVGIKDGLRMKAWGTGPGLKARIDQARQTENLRTTDFFVEHFFGNGNTGNLESIFNRMKDHTYEMVVHPVYYTNYNTLKLPSGIDQESFIHRIHETSALTSSLFSEYRDQYGIKRYPWT